MIFYTRVSYKFRYTTKDESENRNNIFEYRMKMMKNLNDYIQQPE